MAFGKDLVKELEKLKTERVEIQRKVEFYNLRIAQLPPMPNSTKPKVLGIVSSEI